MEEIERLISNRLSFASWQTKNTLFSLFQHCSNDEKCQELLTSLTTYVAEDIQNRHEIFITKTSESTISSWQQRAIKAIDNCKKKIDANQTNRQLHSLLMELTNILEEIFTEVRDSFKNMKEQIVNLKNDIDLLKCRQMHQDRPLLIRDLFMYVRRRLTDEIRRVNLNSNHVDPLYDENLSIEQIASKWPFLYYITEMLSKEFHLALVDLLAFLRIKRASNANFHLASDIEEFAKKHKDNEDYDLLQFIRQEHLLLEMDEIEFKKLNDVFSEVCRLVNGRSHANEKLTNFRTNDQVKYVYDDGQFYNVLLIKPNQSKSQWFIQYCDQEYSSHWASTARLFR